MKKRILSVLLCLVMVLGLLPTTAFAAEESDNTYPNEVGILERKQGTKNILTTDGLYNGGLRPIYYYDAKKYAGTVDDAGKNIEYADIEAAKTAGCVAYLDADGVYHFLTNVTDKSAYYPGEVGITENKNSKYTNRLSIYRTYVAGPFTKIKIVVHEGLTVNLKYLHTYATTEIVLEEGSKLIIDNTSGGPWDYYSEYGLYKYEPAGLWVSKKDDEKGDLTISGSGTLIMNYETVSKEVFARGEPALLVLGALTIKDNVNVEVNATQSDQESESGHCIKVYGDTNIDTTGYVKANLINLTSTNVNAIERRGSFHVTNASYVEISSTCSSDYGYLINGLTYDLLSDSSWGQSMKKEGWNIETEGSEVSIDGIASSLLTLKKSYAKFTRDGVGGAMLTPYGGTAISSLGKAAITPGTKTFTITGTAADWLKTLVKDGRAEYTLTALVFKNDKLLSRGSDRDFTVAYEENGADSDGNPYIQIQLKNDTPAAGDVYSIAAYVKPVVKDTENQLCDSAIGSWTLTTEEKKTSINSVTLNMSDKLKEGDTSTTAPKITATGTGFDSSAASWGISSKTEAGRIYRATVTLTAKEGYVFTSGTTLAVNGDVLSDKTSTFLSADGKTMTVYLSVPARHNHNYVTKYDDAEHWKVCKVCSAEIDREAHTLTESADGSGKITVTCSGCDYTYSYTDSNVISEVRIHVVNPTNGKTPAELGGYVENGVSYVKGYTGLFDISNVKWTDESGSNVTAFEGGQKYTVSMTLTAKTGKTFAENIATNKDAVKVYPDGRRTEAKNVTATRNTDGTLTVTYTMPSAIKIPATVNITLPTYAVGDKFSDKLPTISCDTAGALTNDARISTLGVYKIENDELTVIGLYDVANEKWTDNKSNVMTDAPTVQAETLYQVYVIGYTGTNITNYTYTNQISDPGNAVESGFMDMLIFSVPYGNYQFADPSKITSVALTVDAPEYGKAPTATATGADNTRYTVSAPTWSPEVTDGKFGAGVYTVSIPVTAQSGYSFDKNCTYTVNGYSATYADGKVSYIFPALTAPHEHDFSDQPWISLDDDFHYQLCKSNDASNLQPHSFGSWQYDDEVDANKHYRECSDCGHKVSAAHDESSRITDKTPNIGVAGSWHTECLDCGKRMNSGTLDALAKIDVANLTVAKPVKGAASAGASTTDTTYTVAYTEWLDQNGDPLAAGESFKAGTVYTAKITLEGSGSNVFTADSTYNKIDGKDAKLVTTITNYTDSVTLTYTFDATAGDYVPVAPTITTTTLPGGKVGETYSALLEATGDKPITWSVDSGNLPDGLTLVGDTIKGTPSKAGSFTFTVKARSTAGYATQSFTVTIADADTAKYHNVTLSGAGTGATGAGSHAEGTTVDIYAGTKSGYTFAGWTSDDVTVLSASDKNASFVMPDKDVTVKANWVYNGGGSGGGGYTYYTIKATAGVNGSISPSGNVSVREGRDQTFTITPNKGYAVAKVLVDSKNVGAVKSYTFENVKKNHTIEVVFMKSSGNPQTGVFVDVPEGSYYEEAVNWAVEQGITQGTDATHFSPDGICTRAQAVTFLWRAAGSPAPKTSTMPFTDVKSGVYYYDAVLWAVENGITKGTSNTTFSPNMNCSRAQIVTFLWRSEKSPAAGTVNPFTDVKADAYYADAVLWAVKEDVTKGTTDTTFSPDADCTRAQIVTFIYRALAE